MVYWLGLGSLDLGSLDLFNAGSNPPIALNFFPFFSFPKSKFPAGSLLKSRLPVL